MGGARERKGYGRVVSQSHTVLQHKHTTVRREHAYTHTHTHASVHHRMELKGTKENKQSHSTHTHTQTHGTKGTHCLFVETRQLCATRSYWITATSACPRGQGHLLRPANGSHPGPCVAAVCRVVTQLFDDRLAAECLYDGDRECGLQTGQTVCTVHA